MLLLLVIQVLLHIQRLLAVRSHHRAVWLLPGLPAPAQRCWAGIRRPHHPLALQVAPFVLQIHLGAQPTHEHCTPDPMKSIRLRDELAPKHDQLAQG